jgi:hypothetical protein
MTAPNGGTVTLAEYGRFIQTRASASMWLALPTLLPP